MSLEQRIDELESKLDAALTMLEQLTGTKSFVVSTSEAAVMLGVSAKTIGRWFCDGKMPKNVGQGSHLKFERKAIERMAEAQKTGRPRKAA